MKTLQECKDEVAASYMRVDSFADLKYGVDGGYYDVFDMDNVSDKASKLYASQFKPEWIPVTERLPEEGSIVELCYKVGDKYYHCLGLNVGYHKIEVGKDDDTLIDDSWYDDGFLTPGLYELIDCSAIRCDYDSYYIKRNAVYWKYLTPLPEPPKP